MRTDEVQVCLPHSESQPTSPEHARAETADERLLRLFNETDTDGGGTLDMKEIKALCRKLGDRMSNAALHEAFERMDPHWTGEVGFQAHVVLHPPQPRVQFWTCQQHAFPRYSRQGQGLTNAVENGNVSCRGGVVCW